MIENESGFIVYSIKCNDSFLLTNSFLIKLISTTNTLNSEIRLK